MDADQAREALAYSEHARRRARDNIGRPWLPLVLLASFSVASVSLTDAVRTPTGLFWVLVGPLGAGAIALYFQRRNRASGIESDPLAYVAITAGLLILAYAAGKVAFAFGLPVIARIGPALVVAAGSLALAWIERNGLVAAVAFALAAIAFATVGLGLGTTQSSALLLAIYGITVAAMGFGMRVRRVRQP